jgi:hypothetical protein
LIRVERKINTGGTSGQMVRVRTFKHSLHKGKTILKKKVRIIISRTLAIKQRTTEI